MTCPDCGGELVAFDHPEFGSWASCCECGWSAWLSSDEAEFHSRDVGPQARIEQDGERQALGSNPETKGDEGVIRVPDLRFC